VADRVDVGDRRIPQRIDPAWDEDLAVREVETIGAASSSLPLFLGRQREAERRPFRGGAFAFSHRVRLRVEPIDAVHRPVELVRSPDA